MGGLVWAMVTDHLDPVLLMILGAVATATDVLMFARDLVQAAKKESEQIAQVKEAAQRKGSDE